MARESKKTRCPKCFKLLCKRIPVHLGKDESYVIHVKAGKLEMYAYDVTIICPSCGSGIRVNGTDGIIQKEVRIND